MPNDEHRNEYQHPARDRIVRRTQRRSALAELLAVGEVVEFQRDEVLFQEAQPADYWWVLLDGTIELVRHVGREDTVLGRHEHARPMGRWFPGLGPARRLHGQRSMRRHRPRTAGAGGRAARPGEQLVPVRRAPDQGADPDRPEHRVDGPATRIPRRPRHSRGRARARDQQPGLCGHPGRRRAAGSLRGRDVRARTAWRTTRSRPPSSPPWTSSGGTSPRPRSA